MTIKSFQKKVQSILKKYKINPNIVGKRESFKPEGVTGKAATEIILASGLSAEIAKAAIYGIMVLCDGEIGGSESYNWINMYDGYTLQYAIELGEQFINKDERCEVGMKYPEFPVKRLVDKYKLVKTGVYEPQFSREQTDARYKTFYEVWENKETGISFSFEQGRMGKGGYAGGVFPTFNDALAFVKWYAHNSKFYIKDLDIFVNGLGGLGIKQLNEFHESQSK